MAGTASGATHSQQPPSTEVATSTLGLDKTHLDSLLSSWLVIYAASLKPQGFSDKDITLLAFEKALEQAMS